MLGVSIMAFRKLTCNIDDGRKEGTAISVVAGTFKK